MNSEEFINKHLVRSTVVSTGLATTIAGRIINKTVESYREGSFNNLQELVKDAKEKIKSATGVINELSKDGGTTARLFAESQQISIATARKRLNSSMLSNKNCDKKPYIYTLIDNG